MHARRRVPRHFQLRKNLFFEGDDRGGRNIELSEFTDKKLVFRVFRNQFLKLYAGYFWLLFPQSRERQHNLRKRAEVMATRSGDFELLDADLFVAVNPGEAEKKGSREEATALAKTSRCYMQVPASVSC